MNLKNFLSELKRRNVYKVAITYSITAWLIAQIVALASDNFNAPSWFTPMVLILMAIGFPIAIILAWAFEMSPQGMIRTTSVAANENPYSERKKKPLTGKLFIGFLIVIIISQFVYSNYLETDAIDTANIEKSIAVLPFINDSKNEDNLYFCNGIMEGILDHLSKIEDLTVVSRTSVEQYRDNKPSLKKIAEELGVQYLVEGSVQRINNQVVIFAQLIYAEEDKHLWSQRYKKELIDVFAVQADVTESIAEKLHAIILPEVKKRIEAIPTQNEKALDYYLKGEEYFFSSNNFLQSSRDWSSTLERARLNYEMAIENDSLMAEAIVGLAWVEYRLNEYSTLLEENHLESVLKLTEKAIAINPDLYIAYLVRGFYYSQTNQIDLAKQDFKKAKNLNPSNLYPLYGFLSITYEYELNYLEGIKILKKLEARSFSQLDINNLNRSYWQYYSRLGDLEMEDYYYKEAYGSDGGNTWYYTKRGMFDESLNSLKKRKSNQLKESALGGTYLYLGDYGKSITHYEKWLEMVKIEDYDSYSTSNDLHRLGQAYYLSGQKEKGIGLLEQQIDVYKRKIETHYGSGNNYHGALYDLAGIYCFLGENEKAYEYLDRFENENGWMSFGDLEHFIKVDPQFDNIRNEKRFQDIVQRGVTQKERIRKEVREYLASLDD